MDRTDEFVSFLGVLGYDHWRKPRVSHESGEDQPRKQENDRSGLYYLATRIMKSLQQNESILKRIEKLYGVNYSSLSSFLVSLPFFCDLELKEKNFQMIQPSKLMKIPKCFN